MGFLSNTISHRDQPENTHTQGVYHVDYIQKTVRTVAWEDPDQVVLQTWDFAGQQMYYSMAHVFITAPGDSQSSQKWI